MARILSLFPASLIAASNGMSANGFYRELRTLGIAARRSEVLSLYKIAVNIVAKSPDEPFRDITQAPTGSDLTPWPTKRAGGVLQTVTLVYRNTVTGKHNTTYYSVKSENGIAREQVLARAINAYEGSQSSEGQVLNGAVHTGAYNQMPFTE